jgi:hypothetical protein
MQYVIKNDHEKGKVEIDMRLAMKRIYKGKERYDRNKKETWWRE